MNLITLWYVTTYQSDLVLYLTQTLKTPIGFNVSLDVDSPAWQLHSGYGSPEASAVQLGGTAKHSTLFPSTQNEKGESRSGLFIFKLEQKGQASLDTPFKVMYAIHL